MVSASLSRPELPGDRLLHGSGQAFTPSSPAPSLPPASGQTQALGSVTLCRVTGATRNPTARSYALSKSESNPTERVCRPCRPISTARRDPVRHPSRVHPAVNEEVSVHPRVRCDVDLPRPQIRAVPCRESVATLVVGHAPRFPPCPAEHALRRGEPACGARSLRGRLGVMSTMER